MTIVMQETLFIIELIKQLPAGVEFSAEAQEHWGFRKYVLRHDERKMETSFLNDPTNVATTAIRGKEALDQMKKWLATP